MNARRLAADLEKRLNQVRRITSFVRQRPRVLILYSVNPIYTSPPDSFIHDLIGIAGGQDIVTSALPQNIISSAVVVERSPDVIICSPTLRDPVRRLPGWDIVPAISKNRFFSAEGDGELTRPGPRIAAAVEQLAYYLHPDLFHKSDKAPRR